MRMDTNIPTDEISLMPFRREMMGYTVQNLKRDLSTGMQVALLALPQAMAYALVAGLPLSCGLYAAIFSSFIAAICGSSRYLVVGPVNTIALLVQFGIAHILFTSYRDVPDAEKEAVVLGILVQLTLLVGFFQMMMGVFKWGRLTQFISHSVVVGYVAGAALAVIITQLFVFMGVSGMPPVGSLYTKAVYLLSHLDQVQYPTLIVGLSSLVLMLGFKYFYPWLPGAAITFLVVAIGVFIVNESSTSPAIFSELMASMQTHSIVDLVGSHEMNLSLLPKVVFPTLDSMVLNDLIPVAFAVTLLSVLESTCVAKSITASSGHQIGMNQEIFAIGIGNMVSAFTGSMPVSVSPSRSGLNYTIGAQTRLSSMFNAIFVALFVHLLGFLVQLIPTATLAALLLITAMSLVNMRQFLLCLKATRADAVVLVATVSACIFLSFDMAFYVGVVISIASYLNKSSIPQLVEFAIEDSGELRSLDAAQVHLQKTIRVIKVEGELFFGAADLFQTTLKAVAENDVTTKVIILQLKNARDIDATTCLAILQLHDFLKQSDRRLILCGIMPPVWDVLSHSGVIDNMGKENLFLFEELHPHLYLQKALSRARELVPA